MSCPHGNSEDECEDCQAIDDAWNSGYKSAYDKGFAAGKLEQWNEFAGLEPDAHMYPSDLEKFQREETFAHAYSVAVGNPDETSVPMIQRPERRQKIEPIAEPEPTKG